MTTTTQPTPTVNVWTYCQKCGVRTDHVIYEQNRNVSYLRCSVCLHEKCMAN